jgi:hypothetical protein
MPRLLKFTFIAMLIVSMASTPTWADRPGYRGGGHGGGHGGSGLDALVLLLFGTALIVAATTPDPPAHPVPTYIPYVPPVSEPPVYVQPPAVAAQMYPPTPPTSEVQQNWWYYCAESAGYYPYVKDCPTGWTRVSPTPPGQ